MAKGLLGSAAPAPTAQPPQQTPQASDKDKADFQQFVAQGMKLLHAPETRDGMLNRLKQGNPIQAIAEVTLTIVDKLESVAQVSDIVKLDGANVLMREVAELAEAAGVKSLTDEEKAQAFSLALEMYVMKGMKNGTMKPEELQQVQGMMGGQNGPA